MLNNNKKDTARYFSKTSLEFDNYYNTDPAFQERFYIITDLLNKYKDNYKIAYDIGCGSGVFSFYMANLNKNVLGVDFSESMIEICNNNNVDFDNLKFICKQVPFSINEEIGKADLILASSLLEYIFDINLTIDFFKKLLNDNGLVIISIPNSFSVYRKFEKISYKLFKKPEYLKYTKFKYKIDEFDKLMETKGFGKIESDFFSYKFPKNNFMSSMFNTKHVNSMYLGVYKKNPENNL
jgi:SAM-dependent methyltransferase